MILRDISAADPAFGMLREADWAAFNLLLLLRDCPGARMQTDGRTCLLAQSGPGFPLWIYLAKAPEEDLARELRGLLLERLQEESGLHVNAQPDRAGALLADAARTAGAQLRVHMPLIAYTCPRIQEGPRVGRLARPRAGCAQAVADLAQVFAEDGEGQALPREEALRWAAQREADPDCFLWEVEGEVVALARVAHRGSCPAGRFARINAVVTARAHRCRGYARMLVREISRECLEQGWTPMLYTDARSPASNRSYAGAGFVRQGEIAEYAFAGEEA